MSSTPSADPAVKLTVTVIDGRVHPVVTSCMEPVVTSQVHDWPASCAAGGVRRVPGAVHAHPLGSAGGRAGGRRQEGQGPRENADGRHGGYARQGPRNGSGHSPV